MSRPRDEADQAFALENRWRYPTIGARAFAIDGPAVAGLGDG